MNTESRHPPVLWAQREDVIYLTVDLHDVKDTAFTLTEESISFENTTDSILYKFHIDFYEPIKVDDSKRSVTGRQAFLVLAKKENSWWPRLTKDKVKLNFLKTDFARWADSDDEEEEQGAPDMSNMNFEQFGGMGGMGGMPGMGGMGGMPGMGGMGGMGGGMPDLSSLAAMGGGGGGMPDLSSLAAMAGGGGGDAAADADDEESEKADASGSK